MTSTTKKALLVLVIIAGLLFAWYASSIQGWAAERGGDHHKIKQWTHHVTNHQQLRVERGGCEHRSRATHHARGGNFFYPEIISFYSTIEWCWGRHNGAGGQVWNVDMGISPDHARLFWRYEGVVAQSGGSYPQYHELCGPTPQPECRWEQRSLQYARGPFDGIEERTTPWIRWVITGSGGCGIVKEVSGERKNERC